MPDLRWTAQRWLLGGGLLLSAALYACGGSAPAPGAGPRALSRGPQAPQLTAQEWQAQADALAQLPAPAGVAAADFAQLKAALLPLLEARAAGKAGSTPPAGDVNLLDDIAFVDAGGGDYTLTWTYKNRGDYDLNGEVNLSDLTQIGQNYHATSADGDWATAQRADGDRNGEVNLSDITPLGQHYQAQVGGYNIYGSANQTGPWTAVSGLERSSGNFAVYPPAFSYHLGPADYAWYLVAPRDFAGVDNVGGGGGGGGGATVEPGTAVNDTTQPVTEGGGTVTGPAGTPLEGISAEFPAGAIDGSANVSLGHTDGSVTPVLGRFGGTILTMTTDGPEQFSAPVKITAPLPAGNIPVPYYINKDGKLELMDIAALNSPPGTFSFYTYHCSAFTWLFEDPPQEHSWRSGVYDSGFVPSVHSFQVINASNQYNQGGECGGMTAWAQWLYRTHPQDQFYENYMQVVGSSGRRGQQIIATRAYTSNGLKWSYYVPMLMAQNILSDIAEYTIIRNAIANTRQPQDLYVKTTELAWNTARHAILAYAVDNGTIKVYDPNSPGNNNLKITIADSLLADFDPFENGGYKFVSFAYVGNGSQYANESFSLIYGDAANGFGDSDDARVRITSHSAGDTLTDRNPTLSGTVESGSVLISEMDVIVNGTPIRVPVDQTGTWSVVAPLKNGDNYISFACFGVFLDKGLLPVVNDQLAPFKLICNTDVTTILVTLTWDQNTDLDLYVIDPANDAAWYSDKTTADGGELDVDNTSGHGPEHFTLTSSDTTRWGQDYMIKVHKYSSGELFTRWSIAVQVNDGEPKVYTGTLTHGDTANKDPVGTGSDWDGFITIRPEQPTP